LGIWQDEARITRTLISSSMITDEHELGESLTEARMDKTAFSTVGFAIYKPGRRTLLARAKPSARLAARGNLARQITMDTTRIPNDLPKKLFLKPLNANGVNIRS